MYYSISPNDIIVDNCGQFPYLCACVVYKCHIKPLLQFHPQALISEMANFMYVVPGEGSAEHRWVC